MLNYIKRMVLMFILIVVCFIIQNTISLYSKDLFVTPNLLLILSVITGYLIGSNKGIIVGFVAGLFVDVLACDIIGMNALLYMYIGFISGFFHKVFYKDFVIVPLALIFIGDFIYNFAYYMFRFLVRNKLDFSYYMEKVVFPEMIITTVVALIVFRVIYFVNDKWLVNQQRSTLNLD